jgi:hypothetical protein
MARTLGCLGFESQGGCWSKLVTVSKSFRRGAWVQARSGAISQCFSGGSELKCGQSSACVMAPVLGFSRRGVVSG